MTNLLEHYQHDPLLHDFFQMVEAAIEMGCGVGGFPTGYEGMKDRMAGIASAYYQLKAEVNKKNGLPIFTENEEVYVPIGVATQQRPRRAYISGMVKGVGGYCGGTGRIIQPSEYVYMVRYERIATIKTRYQTFSGEFLQIPASRFKFNHSPKITITYEPDSSASN